MTKTVLVKFPHHTSNYVVNVSGDSTGREWTGHGKAYAYLYDATTPINKGDFVVVVVCEHGPSLAKVVDVIEGADPRATRYIAAVVDMTGYAAKEAKRKARAATQEELRRLAKEEGEAATWRILAASNPRMAELLKQLEGDNNA